MVFTKACRLTLDELDGNWGHKFRLRVALNVLCALSIGACVYALSQRPTFQSEAWVEDYEVLLYLPYSIVTIVWNVLNIIYLSRKKRHLSPLINLVVHFILAAAAFILGFMATIVVSEALPEVGRDIYGDSDQGGHWILATNASHVWVTPENIATCPAFPNCEAQQSWIWKAQVRSIVALIGCVLVDLSFFLHIAVFVWTLLDLFYSTRPKWPPNNPHQKNIRGLRISDPVLISAPWTSKLASRDSLELLHNKGSVTSLHTHKSNHSTTSLSDIESELNSPTYWYPGRLPQGNAFAEQQLHSNANPASVAPSQTSRLPEIERPPLHQPLFPSEPSSKPAHILVYERKHPGAPPSLRRPRDNATVRMESRVTRHHPDAPGRGGAVVYTPRGSLNDRGLLGRAY